MKYNIISYHNKLALDLPGYDIHRNLHLWEYHNDWNQRFIINEFDDDPGYYNIIIDYNDETTLYLTINDIDSGIKLSSCNNNNNNNKDNQKFRFIETEKGYIIECKLNGLVFDVCGCNMDNGSNVILWKSTGGLNQLWNISITTSIQFPFLNNLNEYSIDFSQLNSDQLLNILDEQGFCIIKNVCTIDEISESKQNIGDDFFELFDMNMISNNEDLLKEYQKFCNMRKDEIIDNWKVFKDYFINKHGLPQGRFAWNLRLNPKIRSIYEKIYNTTDLVTGMDSIFFSIGDNIRKRVGYWGHCDHNIKRDNSEDWQCYQSVIAINDSSNEDSETTVVWPKSHKLFYQTLMEASNSDYSHYIELSLLLENDHFGDVVKGRQINLKYIKEARRVPLQEGDLIIWNSKTIHQGYKNYGRRLAMPVCYEPKTRRTKKSFISKLKYAIEGFGTTHWASLGQKHGVYLKEIENHAEPAVYDYTNTEGDNIELPIKERIIPFIIKDECRDEYIPTILSLSRNLSSDNYDSTENEVILTKLNSKLKSEILKYF